MSLQFIVGNSGSGKSTWLYEQIVKDAIAHPNKNFLFLVPEQFTMQTQKEFVDRHPAHSILNIDVLSFQRLAYRVFDELGMTDFVVLEETGKNLVLRNVASLKEGELLALRGNIRKTGYISEVKSFLSELAQYHVMPEDLAQARDLLESRNALWHKLNDILVLYQGFREFLQGRYVTADEVVNLLTQVAAESGMLKGSVVVLDGYTGFTPVQNAFLEELFGLAESVQVAVTADEREPLYGRPDIQDLFYLSRKTIRDLTEIAGRRKIEILDPVVLDNGKKKRYRNAPAIFHLEQNLFRRHAVKYLQEQESIQIFGMFQPQDELRFVAGEIRRLVSEEDCRYVDIAIVTGDVLSYANYAEEIFALYGIPLFIDQKKNILFHPMIELIRAVLEMETSDYSYESVMRFFKSGLSGMDADWTDLLENYLLAFGIRGWKKWEKSWVRPTAWIEEAELEGLNELRQTFLQKFAPMHEVFHKRQATVREMTAALYGLLVSLQIQAQVLAQKEQLEAAGMLAQARENEQIYGIVMDLFDKIVDLLGEEKISRKEFSEILDAGFEASKVGIIPPGYDRVLFGDIERTRLEHIKILFFIGVNDGIIPKNDASLGILSEFERERLAGFHLSLAPTPRERAFIQKFYLYLNMTKPSQRLYLTYSQTGQDGTARRRSYLVSTVLKMFPRLTVQSPGDSRQPTGAEGAGQQSTGAEGMGQQPAGADAADESGLSYFAHTAETAESSMRFFLSGLKEAKGGAVSEEWKALYAWYMRHEAWAGPVADYVRAAFHTHQDTNLSREICRQLYGSVLENSVTRLERFAGCAFAHFLQYGLQLSKRQQNEFEPLDFGNVLHQALEAFGQRMEAGGDDWFTVTPEQESRYAKEAIDFAIASCTNTALAEGERNVYLVRRMENVLKRTVEVLGRQIRSGSFVPENYEVSFQYVNQLEAIQFTLGEEEKMRLRGRIDRMDVWEREKEAYIRVIDYKSGNTSFQLLSIYHGLQLQLVVYLNAAMELMRKKYPNKEIKPAGIFYYHIDDPILDMEGNSQVTEEEIKEQIFAKLKLDGYVNSDPEVYRAMDHEMGSSSKILPLTENKDGTLRKSSKAASEEQFAVISEYVNRKISELGLRMMQGEISVNPYEFGGQTACAYCPYQSVCGFDERLDGFAYRKLEKFDQAAEIIEKMETGSEKG